MLAGRGRSIADRNGELEEMFLARRHFPNQRGSVRAAELGRENRLPGSEFGRSRRRRGDGDPIPSRRNVWRPLRLQFEDAVRASLAVDRLAAPSAIGIRCEDNKPAGNRLALKPDAAADGRWAGFT